MASDAGKHILEKIMSDCSADDRVCFSLKLYTVQYTLGSWYPHQYCSETPLNDSPSARFTYLYFLSSDKWVHLGIDSTDSRTTVHVYYYYNICLMSELISIFLNLVDYLNFHDSRSFIFTNTWKSWPKIYDQEKLHCPVWPSQSHWPRNRKIIRTWKVFPMFRFESHYGT